METTEATEWTPTEDFDTGLTADDWKEILEDDDFIKNHPAGSITYGFIINVIPHCHIRD